MLLEAIKTLETTTLDNTELVGKGGTTALDNKMTADKAVPRLKTKIKGIEIIELSRGAALN